MPATLLTNGLVSGVNGSVFGAVDTTGASLLVVSVAYYTGIGTPSVSDSLSHTWVPLTARLQGLAGLRLFYTVVTSGGSGHVVTVTGSGIYAVMTLMVFAGTATVPYEAENGAGVSGAGPLATGSVTPAETGAVIVSGWAGMNAASSPVVTGLTQVTALNPVGGVHLAGAAGYTIHPTATAINPSWAWSGAEDIAVGVAAFKAVAPSEPAGAYAHTFLGWAG